MGEPRLSGSGCTQLAEVVSSPAGFTLQWYLSNLYVGLKCTKLVFSILKLHFISDANIALSSIRCPPHTNKQGIQEGHNHRALCTWSIFSISYAVWRGLVVYQML